MGLPHNRLLPRLFHVIPLIYIMVTKNIVSSIVVFGSYFLVGCSSYNQKTSHQFIDWEFPMISKGNNFPSLELEKYTNTLLAIRNHRANSRLDMKEINDLKKEGLVKFLDKDHYSLNFFTVSFKEGDSLQKLSEKPAKDISKIIESKIKRIKKQTKLHPELKNTALKQSLFIFSVMFC